MVIFLSYASLPEGTYEIIIWWFPKIEVPSIIHFSRMFSHKPSILEIPHLWKPPYDIICSCFSLFCVYLSVNFMFVCTCMYVCNVCNVCNVCMYVCNVM